MNRKSWKLIFWLILLGLNLLLLAGMALIAGETKEVWPMWMVGSITLGVWSVFGLIYSAKQAWGR